ncbi:MAG TPA: leucyl aminopeptidase [Acidobacteriota bacterium]|nr:leucyl aminopeptidase [Acidobacteriota bacterium]HQQ47197.1 leucyl aminopeptidase [Acidobacteriota bacterium]
MKIGFEHGKLDGIKSEAVVVGVFEKFQGFKFEGGGDFKKEAAAARFTGGSGEAFFALDRIGRPQKLVLFVGLGPKESYSPAEARLAAAAAVRKLGERFVRSALFVLWAEACKGKIEDAVSAIAEGVILTSARFERYITDKDRHSKQLESAAIWLEKRSAKAEDGLKLGRTLSDAVLFSRDLITAPSNEITPAYLAEEAVSLAKAYGFKAKIMDEKECAKLGMGAYLAVGAGSANPPRFIHLSYKPKNAKFTLGIIGKGMTFDSGGISLKPGEGMGAMKSDMSGAAAVLGAMKAVGELKPKVGVEMVVAACENMPSGSAYRPGDILTSMSGKTIEVQNTDAEGRLTLADALTYMQKQGVDQVVDLATLTGACVVALGTDIAGVMGNDEKFIGELTQLSGVSGDQLWQLPLQKDYRRFIKSPVADICNISRVRWGGAITAGLFLQFFVDEKTPWAHIDIAGPAYRDDDLGECHRAEGAGFGVRLLAHHILGKEKKG